MPAFFSDNGVLKQPEHPHTDDGRYEKVEKGKPLCVEIEHIGFGNIKDWWGKSEVITSSWAKTGRSPKPATRLLNLMRTGISPYDNLEDLGAAQYGTRLVYYSPAYTGQPLRMSFELVEADKLRKKQVDALADGLKSLAKLAVFVPQLAYFSLAPQVATLASRLYGVFNRNDLILFSDLDLSFNEPHRKVLTSGRFLLVKENVNATDFMASYKLATDGNRLLGVDGAPPENSGFTGAYIVIKIDAREKPDYKEFEADSEAEGKIKEYLDDGLDVTEEIAKSISGAVKGVRSFSYVKEVLKLNKKLNGAQTDEEKEALKKLIGDELKNLTEDEAELLKDALEI